MKKTFKIITCIILFIAFSFSVNIHTSNAASKPSTKELKSLSETLSKIPLKYGKKTLYFKVKVTSNNKRIVAESYSFSQSTLKLIDEQHGKKNIKPLTNWANTAIPKVKKLAAKYKYNWYVDVSNNCDSYKPKTFSNTDVLSFTGSCGYSFPIVSSYSNDYKYATIFYNTRYKIKY